MTHIDTKITTRLTAEDIRDLLLGFAGAIELDQMRVDALPAEKCHPAYNGNMWRRYRQDHLHFIDQLLPTVNTISPVLVQELERLAITYNTEIVRDAIIELFAQAATGSCATEEFESAELFFGWLIKDVSRGPSGNCANGDARGLMMRWLAVTDPLQIAEDPECGYGRPTGFVS
jgi:hypothetical protein